MTTFFLPPARLVVRSTQGGLHMKRLIAACLVLAAGCSTLGRGVQVVPPEVRIADLELLESGIFEQRFRVTLRVGNPNDFELPLDGVRFALVLNEQPFARGYTAHRVTVPRLGDATLTVDATTSTFDLIRQVLNAPGRETLTYALDGDVFLKGGARRAVPFTQEGMLELLPSTAVRRLVPQSSTE
jgi:LEA14-like dessication related protein